MNIVLVRQGTRYPVQYVTMLQEMLAEHARGHVVWTLTDQKDTLGLVSPLRHRLPGWWSKIELFSPENRDLRPFLYLDLDTFVLDDISDILAWQPDRLAVLSDFNRSSTQQSAVMVVPDYDDGVWKAFRPEHMEQYRDGGDQDFIASVIPDAIRLQDHFAGLTSFKVHCKEGPVGRVISFHGQPKPHNCETKWVRDVWRRYG